MSQFLKLFQKAAWAPLSVLIFHWIIAKTPFRIPLDFTIHFLGGASIAYFCFHAFGCLTSFLGTVKPLVRYVCSFALACTTGLFWEFAECLSDIFRHTHIQQNLYETMSDLIADATGAFLVLSLILISGIRPRS
jgi:hypothetical protein